MISLLAVRVFSQVYCVYLVSVREPELVANPISASCINYITLVGFLRGLEVSEWMFLLFLPWDYPQEVENAEEVANPLHFTSSSMQSRFYILLLQK